MNVINTGGREGARRGSSRDSPADETPAQIATRKHEALLQSIRAQCLEYLLPALRVLFDGADDLLFDLARRSESYSVKREYFEAMQEIHRRRAVLEDSCISGFLSAFNQCCLGPPPFLASDPPAQVQSGPADDVAQWPSAISFLIENAEQTCARELFALNRRMGILLGRPDLSTRENPAGPATMGIVIRLVMSQIQVKAFIRLLLYTLFDRHLMTRLHSLYGTLNEFLIYHQILPEILTVAQRPRTASTSSPPNRPITHAASPVEPTIGNAHGEPPWLFMDAVSSPLIAPVLVNTKLVRALTALQRSGTGASAGRVGAAIGNVVRGIKIQGGLPPMDQADETRLDLVAMLFDYFLNDDRLPETWRDLIARLQIPILKIALIDNNFFIQNHQPARRLLNTIARTGMGCVGIPLLQTAALDLADRIVQRIQNEFDDDIRLFDVLQAQLEQDIATALGGTTALQDQSRQEEAKRKIHALIDSRLNQKSSAMFAIHESVRNFILTHWQRLLMQYFLREGGAGPLLYDAIYTMDDLIWSTAPKHDDAERARLRQLWPDLLRRLEIGMNELALPSLARVGFLDKLTKCQTGVMGPPADMRVGTGTISEADSLAIAAALLEEPSNAARKRPDPEEITTPREVFFKAMSAEAPSAGATSTGGESSVIGEARVDDNSV